MICIVFRVDASFALGKGHLARCLALASSLRTKGASCHFVGNRSMNMWAESVTQAGHSLSLIDDSLPQKEDALQAMLALGSTSCDWLVVDHYGLDARWHAAVRPAFRRLLVIDDLANRPLMADLVLDPSPCADPDAYRALTPEGCKLLLGPAYCLLREEFARSRQDVATSTVHSSDLHRIHLALGGTDAAGHTAIMARLLLEWFGQAQVVAVLGTDGPQSALLQAMGHATGGRLETIVASRDVAATMSGCTFAVGAPGGTLWERFSMGLPTACVTNSPTQRPVIEKLATAGWLLHLGDADRFAEDAHVPLVAWLADTGALAAQRRLMRQVDGLGAPRVATLLLAHA